MSAALMIERLKTDDVHLSVRDNRLLVDAPAGVLTGERRAWLAQHKQALIAALGESATAKAANSAKDTVRQRIESLPLVEKLRLYGEPWPLKIDGRAVCWLVPDDAAAKACQKDEPVYTVAEAEHLITLPAEDAQEIHKLKAHFGGTITPSAGDDDS